MFMGPRNWFQGMNSASLFSLAGRYDSPIPHRFLAPIDFLKIPALAGRYDNPNPTRFLAPMDYLKIPSLNSISKMKYMSFIFFMIFLQNLKLYL